MVSHMMRAAIPRRRTVATACAKSSGTSLGMCNRLSEAITEANSTGFGRITRFGFKRGADHLCLPIPGFQPFDPRRTGNCYQLLPAKGIAPAFPLVGKHPLRITHFWCGSLFLRRLHKEEHDGADEPHEKGHPETLVPPGAERAPAFIGTGICLHDNRIHNEVFHSHSFGATPAHRDAARPIAQPVDMCPMP
jgi:hypothetical protein